MTISRGDSPAPSDKSRPPVPPAGTRPQPIPPKITPHAEPEPHAPQTPPTPARADRRPMWIAGLVLIAALIAVIAGAQRETRSAKAPEPAEPVAPPAPPVAPPQNAEEWVARVRISGVRATRLIADGNIYQLDQPIPPFQVRWKGKTPTELIFADANGVEIRRPYARSFNSDPTVTPPANTGDTPAEP